MLPSLLIVDDEKNTREGLRTALEDDFEIYTAADVKSATLILQNDTIDALLTDLRLGSETGMHILHTAMSLPTPPLTLMMTAYGSVETAVEAMKHGAWHFITKPINIHELEILIKRGLKSRNAEQENIQLRLQINQQHSLDQIIGSSHTMQQLYQTIKLVANSNATVLIEGESGTGKELTARALHNLSPRSSKKLITTHCAALPDNLIESELFGHEKGAFTGATERRIGRFEQAHHGTLFLDEIGEINPSTQIKLLRAIGEQTIERLGSSTPIHIDVRLLTATNKNLVKLVEQGHFREDLFYRLNVVRLHMPPLRERKEDILPLTQHILKTLAAKNNKPPYHLHPDTLKILLEHDWPGNIRELRTALEHGTVMTTSPKILPHHLPQWLTQNQLPRPENLTTTLKPLPPETNLNLAENEKQHILEALRRTRDNKSEAAKLLGISRRTLHRKWNELFP